MKPYQQLSTVVIAIGILSGCASTPPASPAAPAAAPTTTTFAPAQGAAAGAPAAPAPTELPETIKMARNLGYRPQQRGGVTVYCRTEAQIGTHFEKTSCVSEESLPELVRQQQAAQQAISNAQRNCNGVNCGGQ